ncbi:MAG TPA: CehA/McbA family metallohydrolase [Luteolibacter sp.]|nr:CehA/McbA family metallohydrolase [Luteolibacter sp.]
MKNYVIGQVRSPELSVRSGELITFAAEISTDVPAFAKSYYRVWLGLEFSNGDKKIAEVFAPELGGGIQATLVGVTGQAPAGATGVKAVIFAQNKFWAQVKNRSVIRNPKVMRLSNSNSGSLEGEVVSPLSSIDGKRSATVAFRGPWPDGTALSITSTKGSLKPTVLFERGKGRLELHYSNEDVGRATITATVMGKSAGVDIEDPLAGRIVINDIVADGIPSPAVARIAKDGKMVPGRYQTSVPGMFITPPHEIELLPGSWSLEISKGPQFATYKTEVQIKSGATRTLEPINLVRRVDPKTEGWYGGDSDGDVYHGERIYTDVDARTAATISTALGLDWVGAGNWGAPNPKTWKDLGQDTKDLGSNRLLFMWTDENPKTRYGHGCFVGLQGPDSAGLKWAWSGAKRPLENFEVLSAIRAHGGATFVNHPLRWWMKGDRFNSNMYSSLPFDLCVASALDGFNINDGPKELGVWSMLLDHGYRVAATAGADFCLDRPIGPLPGTTRMYAYCPDGLSVEALSRAVRNGNTVVTTGPVLLSDVDGLPPGSVLPKRKAFNVRVRGWARGDLDDPLETMELWSHGKAIASHSVSGTEAHEHVFEWTPSREADWMAVRLRSKKGWAMTSAFYVESEAWKSRSPLACQLEVNIDGLTAEDLARTKVEVWDREPGLPGAVRLKEIQAEERMILEVPATATIVANAPKRSKASSSVYEATGVRPLIEQIARGEKQEQPLTSWAAYEHVILKAKSGTLNFNF